MKSINQLPTQQENTDMKNGIDAASFTTKKRHGKDAVLAGATLSQPLSPFEALGLDLAATKTSEKILAELRRIIAGQNLGAVGEQLTVKALKGKAPGAKVEEPTLAVRTCAYAKCKHGPLDPKWPVARKVHDDSCLKRFVKTFKAEQKALLEASEEVELSSDDTMAAPASEEMDAPKSNRNKTGRRRPSK